MNILHRDDLLLGGFAGLQEHRLVTDSRVFGNHEQNGAWDGIGNFVYLADAKFLPKGETRLHNHKEIDVISIMVDGRIMHEGSMEHGQQLESNHVQVQRAGGDGFSHNEINPDEIKNRMIQLWVLPEQPGQKAGYKLYSPKEGELTRIYGGKPDQQETFDSHTIIDIGMISTGNNILLNGVFMAYITRGSGRLNGQSIKDSDLIRGENLEFTAEENTQLILIRNNLA